MFKGNLIKSFFELKVHKAACRHIDNYILYDERKEMKTITFNSHKGRGLCRVVSVFTAPVVAPRSLWRLPPPASVASSFVFTVLSSIIPTPVKTAPASLCRVVSCLLFSALERVVLNLWRGSLNSSSSAQAVSPSPRPYLGLLGDCPRRS